MYTFILLIVFVLALAAAASYFIDVADTVKYDDKPEEAKPEETKPEEAINTPKKEAVAAKPIEAKAKKKAVPKNKPKPKRRPRDR